MKGHKIRIVFPEKGEPKTFNSLHAFKKYFGVNYNYANSTLKYLREGFCIVLADRLVVRDENYKNMKFTRNSRILYDNKSGLTRRNEILKQWDKRKKWIVILDISSGKTIVWKGTAKKLSAIKEINYGSLKGFLSRFPSIYKKKLLDNTTSFFPRKEQYCYWGDWMDLIEFKKNISTLPKFTIEEDHDIPYHRNVKYPFYKMKVNDSFIISENYSREEMTKYSNAARGWAKKNREPKYQSYKFSLRKTHDNKIRIFRIK